MMKKIILISLLSVATIFGIKKMFFGLEGLEGKSKHSPWTSAVVKSEKKEKQAADQTTKKLEPNKGVIAAKKKEATSIANPFQKDLSKGEVVTREEAQAFAYREIDFKPQSEEEGSLLEMNRLMAANFLVSDSHKDLIKFYTEKGLKPSVSRDSNPYTGTMIIVRTEKSLPGTRYPHNQSFVNERGESDTQHFSIEYRPGPNAFKRADELVRALYNVEKAETSPDGSFIKYKPGAGQIVWIKKMGPEDLKNSPFNAYEESDVGTIRMVIEQEIHFDEGGDEDGHQHVEPSKK